MVWQNIQQDNAQKCRNYTALCTLYIYIYLYLLCCTMCKYESLVVHQNLQQFQHSQITKHTQTWNTSLVKKHSKAETTSTFNSYMWDLKTTRSQNPRILSTRRHGAFHRTPVAPTKVWLPCRPAVNQATPYKQWAKAKSNVSKICQNLIYSFGI